LIVLNSLEGDEVQFISGKPADLQCDLMTGVARYRHKVFVETLGWQLQCQNGLEYDQFDRDDTVYVVAQNEDNEVIGTARLLPTNRPYLLGDVFPQLLNGLPVPDSADVWELSRFAAVDFNAATSSALAQFSSPIAIGLLHTALKHARSLGAKQLITVSPLGIERLLRKAGFRAHRAGPPMIVNGAPIFASWIDVDIYPVSLNSISNPLL
jgi:acyl homoserine lactone synthase